MKFLPLLLTLLLSTFSSLAQTTQEQLVELDKGWERALLNSEVEFLDKLLAEEFIWVHNHATQIDGKAEALSRAKKYAQDNSRTIRETEVLETIK